MNKQLAAPFQVTVWDLSPYDQTEGAPTLMKGTVKKNFDGGEIKGESSGEILMYTNADGSAAYTVLDKFDVEVGGRRGTFVAIHGATHTPEETSRALGKILTGSGTGELIGISGTIEFKQGENGKTFEMDFDL